jgi:aminoglycoside 6'-N-acetyltransferase
LARDGLAVPLILRTYCSAADRISSSVAGGSKLCRVLMLRHMGSERSGPVARMMSGMDDDLTAGRLTLRPLVAGDAGELRRIHRTPEVARWWEEPGEAFPWDEPESTRLTIEVDGAVAGMIQFWEEREPKYRHAGIDLFLDPALHGRGVGSEAVRRVVRQLFGERGHHRITIDPAADNTAAIRAYARVGFRPVGVMRSYERDAGGPGWHDGLLMELLAGEER